MYNQQEYEDRAEFSRGARFTVATYRDVALLIPSTDSLKFRGRHGQPHTIQSLAPESFL